jgi:hypothetical protein
MLDKKIEQQINITFLMNLKNTAMDMFNLLCEVCGENTLSRACLFEWHKRFSEERQDVEDDGHPGCLVMKTDENVGEVRTCKIVV